MLIDDPARRLRLRDTCVGLTFYGKLRNHSEGIESFYIENVGQKNVFFAENFAIV